MALMPIVYLVILGHSMGGDLHHLPLALVVQDQGVAAGAVREQIAALAQSRRLFDVREESDVTAALERLREGMYRGIVIVPPDFSDDVARGERAELGLAVDNTDAASANTIESEVRRAMSE